MTDGWHALKFATAIHTVNYKKSKCNDATVQRC